MWKRPLMLAHLGLVFLALVGCTAAPAPTSPAARQTAQPAPAAKAEQPAGKPGFLALASHTEIEEKAKQEGSLRISLSYDPATHKAMQDGFTKKYPFLKVQIVERTGQDSAQAQLMELKARGTTEWDIIAMDAEVYGEYPPYMAPVDLLGMAEKGVLHIPAKMIEPRQRNHIASTSTIGAIAYNKKLVSEAQVPKVWEDFLKPEFKGRKFVADLRPNNLAGLVPLKGLDWVLDYSTKLAAQEPIWARGSKVLTQMAAGEYAIHSMMYYHSIKNTQRKGPDLEVAFVDPIPLRITGFLAPMKASKNLHAALLFLEYVAGPEGQKLLDELEPVKSSFYAPNSETARVIRGKNVSIADWEWIDKIDSYMEQIIKAFGFPKAEIQ